MSAQLRDIASELAAVLWREHTVYRDRSGEVVIRGDHVQRWISLSSGAGADEVLLRAGRILDGGTTAPARCEAIARRSAGTGELATVCRRLLAETAPGATGAPRPGRAGRPRRPRRTGRHTGWASWLVVVCVVGLVAYYLQLTRGVFS
ncbi:hypothetical protein OHS33_33160 [Streptomyces sp. NBC_00536]|uniref:hypothetical protein n=1 Tax=Streptomyces sp. NBC_00536 TaxID=2975769 RepID=UPI002E80717A|nr:hypothetical protein [Streptomyces sp. NBC_00536]WUC82791.1 hypothetical protein OHS33_33160 [Streptomyces sp. NBC_00536]